MSLAGIGFANKCYESWRWFPSKEGPGYHDHIRRGNVRWININFESQANDAKFRAYEVRSQTRIRVRHMLHTPPGSDKNTDDGMWKLPWLEWLDNIVMAHNYHNTGWYVLDSNEFSTANEAILNEYIDSRIAIINEVAKRRKAGNDIRLALLSTPSHWPAFSEDPKVKKWLEQGKLDRLFVAIAANQGPINAPLITVGPNAYYNELNDDGLRNVVAIWERFLKATGKPPHMVVGELAYARPLDSNGRIDAHGGYLAVNMPPTDMITGLVGRIRKYFLARGIYALPYCEGFIGGNEVLTFHLGQATLGMLMDAIVTLDAPEPTNPPPTLPDKDAAVWDDAKLINQNVNLRDAPFAKTTTEHEQGKLLITVPKGSDVKVWQEPNYFEDGYQWFGVWYGEHIGWMALLTPTFAEQFQLLPTGPDPDVPGDPEPDPDDTTEIPGALYITRAEHEAAMENLRHELITFVEAKFDTVIETVLTAEAKALLKYASEEHKEAIQLIDRRAS